MSSTSKSILNAPDQQPAADDEALAPLRRRIDDIDSQLLALISERARLAQEVGRVKHARGEPVYRPEREAQVLARLAEANTGPLPSESIRAVWLELMSACRALEAPLAVAYLGPEGTFSEAAALAQFGSQIEAQPCVSIDEVFRAVEAGAAGFGVVPVENSTEGSVNRTLDLLLGSSLSICAELALPIEHCLLTQSGTLEGITEVRAHPQALAQCQAWLSVHAPNLARVAAASNGAAAQAAAQAPHLAAIAGLGAAQRYGLKAFAEAIQDDPHNRTRFQVIGRVQTQPSGQDHTSLILSVPNRPGAVYDMLAPLAEHGVSMTRFESRPARTGQWEYYFYIDLAGHQFEPRIAAALEALRSRTAFFKLLGSYPVKP
ncbi:MAG TPA: prephenate dehydratase [Burkholderiaceae bacterium]|nr:prephenate dehydratase [Burkholderiaceae bacterium]